MKTKKMVWPDAIRVISVFLVILIHTSAPTVLSWSNSDHFNWMVGNIFDSLARISVPLFVMLSGSLLLHKKENLETFLKKRTSRILLPWFFWGTILLFFNNYFGFALFGEKDFKLLLIENFLGGFWFMPMIFGLYIVTPILKKFVLKANFNELKYYFFIWIIFSSIIPAANNLLDISINFNTPTWFLYSGYFIGGYYIVRKMKIANKNIKKLNYIFLANLFITIIGTYLLSLKNNLFVGYLYEFTAPNIVLMSFSSFIVLFKFFKKAKLNKVTKKYLRYASHNSFGVLLGHIMIVKLIPTLSYPLLSIPTLAIIVFIVSNTSIHLISLFVSQSINRLKLGSLRSWIPTKNNPYNS
jgi:surface polysaccharide O-acyltransferase-like enzyme